MTQTNFLTCCRGSECHNWRKLPPLSHKSDYATAGGTSKQRKHPLCSSVKVVDPNTAAVYSCSESERSSGRCPPLLQYQETPSENWNPWQEASVTTFSSEVVFWIVSWGKPGEGEVTLCQVIASQSWFGRRGIVLRQQEPPGCVSHQTTGHPLFSEEARLLSNPSAQRSPLTMLTESPVQVRFTLDSQANQMKTWCLD